MSEGRATGIPTIQDELRKNGSGHAKIETDEDRTYFIIEIPCRDGFVETVNVHDGMINGTINGTINKREIELLAELKRNPGAKKNELADTLNISVRTLSRIIQNLSSEPLSLIEYQGSKKTGGYVLTDKGVTLIEKGTNNIS